MSDSAALFSIDVESFTHTPAYRRSGEPTGDLGMGLDGVDFLLDALDSRGANGTFFVVSELAEEHPEVVTKIADAGHEIGSHTHTHQLLTSLKPDEVRTELSHSRDRLESVAGVAIDGFRAPAFDLPTGYFSALHRAGYRYDSSVVPSRQIPGWYGGEFLTQRPAPASAFREDAPADLSELPVSVMPGLRLPLTGAWLRLVGVRYALIGMRLLSSRGIAPVLYVHPWELVDLPRLDGVPSRVYWRTGAWMRRAVNRILAEPLEFVSGRILVDRMVPR